MKLKDKNNLSGIFKFLSLMRGFEYETLWNLSDTKAFNEKPDSNGMIKFFTSSFATIADGRCLART